MLLTIFFIIFGFGKKILPIFHFTMLAGLLSIRFWRYFKDVQGDSFIMIWKSHLNLLPYLEGHKSTIIADKLIKFTGHQIMVALSKAL